MKLLKRLFGKKTAAQGWREIAAEAKQNQNKAALEAGWLPLVARIEAAAQQGSTGIGVPDDFMTVLRTPEGRKLLQANGLRVHKDYNWMVTWE